LKKYLGVKTIREGEVYEINFRPYKKAKRVFRRVEAKSKQEAHDKLIELKLEAKKVNKEIGGVRLSVSFAQSWQEIQRGLLAENLPQKTVTRYEKIHNRLFGDFRFKEFPQVDNWNQLGLPFFLKYQNYFCIDLGRVGGWRSELIVVKAIVRRAYRLGFCQEGLIKDLEQIKRPRRVKKAYPEISNEGIRQLLDFIKANRPDYYGVIYFIHRTGRRIEETTRIEKRDLVWDRIKWDKSKLVKIDIRAETTKTKRGAPLLSLPSDLEKVIREAYLISMKHKAPFLFLNKFHRKCYQAKINEYLKVASEKIIKIKITPHYFRHRFFTESAKKNLPMVDVMEISGLRDAKVLLEYYSHGTADGRKKVFDETSIL